MVQKHEMIADFEQLHYNEEMLKQRWKDELKSFETLVKTRWADENILDFLQWINQTNCTAVLFPGNSLGTLLISKPINGKLNYQQTLSIRLDNTQGIYTMSYSDWDVIESRENYEKAILWQIKCFGIELVPRFLEFLEWKKDWR